jgi:hypothetical protein
MQAPFRAVTVQFLFHLMQREEHDDDRSENERQWKQQYRHDDDGGCGRHFSSPLDEQCPFPPIRAHGPPQ